MTKQIRKTIMERARRIVIKLGTAVLADEAGGLSPKRMRAITADVARLVKDGRQVVLVSSGAIGAGLAELGLKERPEKLDKQQALAAVGQSLLIQAYEKKFRRQGLHAGQILVTRQTFEDRKAYLNVKRTIAALESYGGIAIINENDSVSTDEIRLGENDILSAMVANLVGADLLILLTCVDGLLDESGNVVEEVFCDANEMKRLVRSSKSRLGTGGMNTKLEAARMITRSGEAAIIANGAAPHTIKRIVAGESVGTLFLPSRNRLKGKKRWLRFAGRPAGSIIVDAGARSAVVTSKKSLLASGVTDVRGRFETGDLVAIETDDGHEFARGITKFSADDILKIRKRKSNEIAAILGAKATGIVVHCDNLAVLD